LPSRVQEDAVKKARVWRHGEMLRAVGEELSTPLKLEPEALARQLVDGLDLDEVKVLAMERARRVNPRLWQPHAKWGRFWAPLWRTAGQT
jgi:hypothetical protein